jgi:hypothetical protein
MGRLYVFGSIQGYTLKQIGFSHANRWIRVGPHKVVIRSAQAEKEAQQAALTRPASHLAGVTG